MMRNIVRVRPLFNLDHYVCDIKTIMRTRLFFGLFNTMYTPKNFHLWTKIYSVIVALFLSSYYTTYMLMTSPSRLHHLFLITTLVKLVFIWSCSILTDDSYVSSLFTLSRVTDITLDSPPVFTKLKSYIQSIFWIIIIIKLSSIPTIVRRLHHWTIICVDTITDLNALNQLTVLALMYSRIVILRRKMERYGFKNKRDLRRSPKDYAEMYLEIMYPYRAVYALKLMIAIDLLYYSLFIICMCVMCAEVNRDTNSDLLQSLIFIVLLVFKMTTYLLLNCITLCAVSDHVEAIQAFIGTELIKYPTASERRIMYDFLVLIEAMPPRFSLFRLVDVDIALLLTVLASSTSRIIVIVQTFY